MADDADEFVVARQGGQGVHCLFQCVGVQSAEALVDEEGVDAHTSGALLDDVADAQSQAEGGHKAFATRQAGHRTVFAGVGVKDIQVQCGLARDGVALAAAQTVLAVGHAGKPPVGGLDDLVKIEGLDVLLKGQLDPPRYVAVEGAGQAVQHGVALMGGIGPAACHRQLFGGGTVGGQALVGGAAGGLGLGAAGLLVSTGLFQGGQVGVGTPGVGQGLREGPHPLGEGGLLFLGLAAGLGGVLQCPAQGGGSGLQVGLGPAQGVGVGIAQRCGGGLDLGLVGGTLGGPGGGVGLQGGDPLGQLPALVGQAGELGGQLGGPGFPGAEGFHLGGKLLQPFLQAGALGAQGAREPVVVQLSGGGTVIAVFAPGKKGVGILED